MSTISGEPSKPRRHYRLRNPQALDPERAAEIYATAYEKDPEFYAFYRSINAYKNAIGKDGDVLVLDPGNEFFRYLNNSSGNQ